MYGRDSNRLEPKRLVPNLITQNTELTHSWEECEIAHCVVDIKNLNMHFRRLIWSLSTSLQMALCLREPFKNVLADFVR